MADSRGRQRLFRLLLIIWCAGILIATAWPIKEMPVPNKYHLDKLVHFGMFLVMSFAASRAVSRRRYFYLGIALALVSEIQQYFIPGRTFDLLDLTFNLIGLAIGFIAFHMRFSFQQLDCRRCFLK